MLIPMSRALKFLWLEITKRCNLTCLHCYADSSPQQELFGEMAAADWKAVISEASDLGCDGIQFIGGEPTLHPGLVELTEYARAAGIGFVEVFTNATGITDRLASAFKGSGVSVACSFYSAEAAVHDRITQRKGSFAQTVSGIKKLLAYGIPLRAELIEMAENKGQTGAARGFLKALGVTRGGADRQRAIGRGDRIGLGRSQLNELCGKCSDGRLCVTATGVVFPCIFSRFCPLGDARNGLSAILAGEALSEFCGRLDPLHRSAEDSCRPDKRCQPDIYPCDPTDKCSPDCRPNVGCSPDEGSCNPEEDCTPEGGCSPGECNPVY